MPTLILLGDSTRRRYEPALRAPLYAAVEARGAAELLGADGAHFTDEGSAFLAARVAAAIIAAVG